MPFALIRHGLFPPRTPPRHLPAPVQLKKAYDVVIIGGGGHGLATADHLARYHGITRVAVLEKDYLDLRAAVFDRGRIAQTTLARSNAIVIRADIGSSLAYYVLGDCASAEYVWDSLLDAMQEFAGQPAGIDALRRLRS